MKADHWSEAEDGQVWLLLVRGVWHETRFQEAGDGVPGYFYGPTIDITPLYPSEAKSIQAAKRLT